MNYLAHILLSGEDRMVQLGNFVGDAVKGSRYNDYSPSIRNGILLHRAIDNFTDSHPSVRQTVLQLKPQFGRYSGVLVDIFFDNLLASRFGEFCPNPLPRYARSFYVNMILNRKILPDRIKGFMWHFICTDRLCKYATVEGIGSSLELMVRYDRIDVSVDAATAYLKNKEPELRALFEPFFRELHTYCNAYLRNGLTTTDHE